MGGGSGKSFALIGAAGFVAPRHMRAIKEVGGRLQAALDPFDSVGVLDAYFPSAQFFVEFERFDRHIDLLQRRGHPVDFVSICSPNYLHDSHVRFALRSGAHAICEKPLVLNPWHLDGLAEMERSTGCKINTIMQLRLHPAIQQLRQTFSINGDNSRIHDVDLTYITCRGDWYYVSWKGDDQKSGGIATNIGVHLFDMLSFVFGRVETNIVHHRAHDSAAGYIVCQRARVRWFLSINGEHLPKNLPDGTTSFRSITIDGEDFEFSNGLSDLHTHSYAEILAGRGFGLDDIRSATETVSHIRSAPIEYVGEQHPLLDRAHPVAGYARAV